MPVNDPAGAVVLGMDTSNVDMVMVAGRVVKRGGRLVDVDLGAIAHHAYEARDQLFRRAGVRCASPRHLGVTPEPGRDRGA